MTIGVVKRSLLLGSALALALTLFIDIAVLVVPIYDMQLYDRVLMSRNMDTVAMLSVACIVGLSFYFVLDYLRSACFASIARITANQLYGSAFAIGIRRAAAGDRRTGPQLTRDVAELQSFLSSGAIAVPLDALCSPLFVALLFVIHPAFGYITLAGISGLLVIGLSTEYLISPALLKAQERRRWAEHRLSRSIAELELTEGQGMLAGIARRWSSQYGRALVQLYRAGTRAQFAVGCSRTLRFGLQAAVMAVGAVLIVRGDTTPGSLMGANLLVNKCVGPFDHLVESCKTWLSARDSWRRIDAALTAAETLPLNIVSRSDAPGLVVTSATVRTESGKALIEDVGFSLAPGTLALLDGPNGSGKTTLLRMLAGTIAPTRGTVRLSVPPGDGRPNIGYLPQSVGLLEASVAANIGRAEPDLRQVTDVARLVGIHELIGRMPRGYETMLSRDGGSLSGGMRQRIGLARALYNQPHLILLDEPDANLDGEGTRALVHAVTACCRAGAIVIVSSHRGAFRQVADVVLEMRRGRLNDVTPPVPQRHVEMA